jgi:hypothetical protein
VPDGLCECGCGERPQIAPQTRTDRGWIRGEPKRFVAGHQRRLASVEYVEEDRGYETPCWIWQRSVDSRGYGSAALNDGTGRSTCAHKIVYEREHGPVPDGFQLDHLCRIPACVNPDHLEPVTNAVNTQRGAKAKLNPEKVRAIRTSPASTSALARHYGVSYDCIAHVRRGDRWANVV